MLSSSHLFHVPRGIRLFEIPSIIRTLWIESRYWFNVHTFLNILFIFPVIGTRHQSKTYHISYESIEVLKDLRDHLNFFWGCQRNNNNTSNFNASTENSIKSSCFIYVPIYLRFWIKIENKTKICALARSSFRTP